MKTPVLETKRLQLRPLNRNDAQAAWLWASDEQVNMFMSYPLHKSIEDTLQWLQREEAALEDDTSYDFGFVRKDSGELIGSGGLCFQEEKNEWVLGYNLRRDCWNQGYTTEAAARILQFGCEQLHIRRFIAQHAKENPASGRVMEKNGFRYVRDSVYKKIDSSRIFESREYVLEASDWEIREVERFYDERYEEWDRLDKHPVEFEVTKRYLQQYIGDGEKAILDIGGGPGRYSIFLAKQGHRVTLFDLSGKNIRIAIEKAAQAQAHLDSCIQGDALRLSEYLYKKEQFDVVLLMGPLYHLLQEEDRKRALYEALRVLKPGGILVAAFISNYGPILDYGSKLYDFGDIEQLLHYLEDGRNHDSEADGFTKAYFSSVWEARALMEGEGLKELAFAGVENILCGKEEMFAALPEVLQKKWMELAWRLSSDKNLLGASQHYLYIGQKNC